MAGEEGFEPPTCGFGDRCSSQLNYSPLYKQEFTTIKKLKLQFEKFSIIDQIIIR